MQEFNHDAILDRDQQLSEEVKFGFDHDGLIDIDLMRMEQEEVIAGLDAIADDIEDYEESALTY